MKAYLLAVIVAAVFGGLCEELLPDGGGMRKQMTVVTGICVLAVLVLPLKDALYGLGQFFGEIELSELIGSEERAEEYESVFDGAMQRVSAEETGRLLGERLSEEFDLKAETCRAAVVMGESGEVKRVVVYLSGSSILQSPYEIEEYVGRLFSCPCDVAIE